MSSHSLRRRDTEIENQAYLEAVQHFADQIKQLPAHRDNVSRLERDIAKLALATMAASGKPTYGEQVSADDGCLWRKSVELFDNVFVCHREVERGMEYAVIERFPSGANEIWIKGRNAVDVLKAFTHDQRQALEIWTEDMTAQLKEFLAQKFPGQDMTHVIEDFLGPFTQTELLNYSQRQNREIRS
jgi:hypothetical protein